MSAGMGFLGILSSAAVAQRSCMACNRRLRQRRSWLCTTVVHHGRAVEPIHPTHVMVVQLTSLLAATPNTPDDLPRGSLPRGIFYFVGSVARRYPLGGYCDLQRLPPGDRRPPFA